MNDTLPGVRLPRESPGRAVGFAPLFAAGVAVLLMILVAHGCHGPDEDLEPGAVPGRVDGPDAG